MSDIDLLGLEMDTLWGTDHYDRETRPHPLVALAVAGEDVSVRFAPEVVGESFPEIRSLGELEGLRERLAPRWSVRLARSLGYVFETNPEMPDNLRVLTSRDDPSMLYGSRPESWWEVEEWAGLLAGRLGPWAMAVYEGRVVSLCHTPVASKRAAEAGVWTHPDFRGQGWASVVTVAWAGVASEAFEVLFYSTDFGNAASQAVARKLGLRPVGWIGQLVPVGVL